MHLVKYYDSNIGIDTIYTYCGHRYPPVSDSDYDDYTFNVENATCLECLIANIVELEELANKIENQTMNKLTKQSKGPKAMSIVALVLASVALLLSVISLSIGNDDNGEMCNLCLPSRENIVNSKSENNDSKITILPVGKDYDKCTNCTKPLSEFDIYCPNCMTKKEK